MAYDLWTRNLERERSLVLPRYESFARQLLSLIEALCAAENIVIQTRTWRIKSVDSISRKLREDKSLDKFRDVRDLCGIRVVVSSLTDIARIRKVLCRELDVVAEKWLGQGKADVFGYHSLHLQLRVDKRRGKETEWSDTRKCEAELQIRTVLQDGWAIVSREYDYNTAKVAPDKVRRRLFRAASLIESSDEMLDQYCTEVKRARKTYKRLATTNKWISLPLDVDSLNITWSRYDWEAVAHRSRRLGYKKPSKDLLVREDDEVTSLLYIAQAAGMRSTGDLASFVRSVGKGRRNGDLRAVRSIAMKRGLAPYAVGWQVATIPLLIDNPTELNKSVLSPHLRKAISKVATTKS
jgi:ppGpp synthetase/RelA/SpoT-type nucleotidyltranferase